MFETECVNYTGISARTRTTFGFGICARFWRRLFVCPAAAGRVAVHGTLTARAASRARIRIGDADRMYPLEHLESFVVCSRRRSAAKRSHGTAPTPIESPRHPASGAASGRHYPYDIAKWRLIRFLSPLVRASRGTTLRAALHITAIQCYSCCYLRIQFNSTCSMLSWRTELSSPN